MATRYLKCIDNSDYENSLVLGKVYLYDGEDERHYYVLDHDTGKSLCGGTFKSRWVEMPDPKEVAPIMTTQVGGNHYTKLAIQPMEYSMRNNLGPAEHTVIKYVTRWKDKGGVEDLRKAQHCLSLLIEFVERNNG